MGLIWFAPVAEAKGQEAGRILELAAPLFAKRGFDMPVTITLVSAERMVAVLNISFDKTDPQEKSRAWALYDELREKFAANAIGMYRSSIMNMSGLTLQDPARQEVLNRIKSVLDPDQIISRGRYGIGWPRENQG
jgi:4-cresol dehydrogenase (hydroxylating)